ncbi:hypothetical protein [Streptomyces niveus]|uniref:hypothetical protein n=1 Tax=Streptomyces niveus TaxID=193462 RepID=UPI0033F7798D
MDRLLGGELPPGRKPDIKSLAAEAGISRQLFYSRDKGVTPGLYQHLAQEFDRLLAARRELGEAADPRQAQVERLHAANADLKRRLAERERKSPNSRSSSSRPPPGSQPSTPKSRGFGGKPAPRTCTDFRRPYD